MSGGVTLVSATCTAQVEEYVVPVASVIWKITVVPPPVSPMSWTVYVSAVPLPLRVGVPTCTMLPSSA